MKAIRIVEVGPRDGLQNEPKFKQLSKDALIRERVNFVTALADSGLKDVEAGAFVREDRVPQMASTDKVLEIIRTERPDLWKSRRFWVLVPNQKGLELALNSGAKHISVFTATSDQFNERNIGMTVRESLKVLKPLIHEAKQARLKVRGYISTVWGCPYAGKMQPAKARSVAQDLLKFGADEISLGDTIGVATPKQVDVVLDLIPKKWPIAVHFHDTRGTAIANSLHAIEHGIEVVDSSAGGLGGCPYARGASGNLATEDLLYMLHGMGFRTGVNLDAVCAASMKLSSSLELNLPSRYFRAWMGAQKTVPGKKLLSN